MKYQPIHAPEDIMNATNEEDSFNNKIQNDHFDSDHFILQDGYSDKYEDEGQTHFNNENNSEDMCYDELDSNKTIDQEDQVLLAEGSNNSINVSKTGLTSTSTCLQGLVLQYLHKAVITIFRLCHLYKIIIWVIYILLLLQISLRVFLHEDILHHLYKGIYTTVHLVLSLLTPLRSEGIRPSLRVSVLSEILQSSLFVSLRSGILQSSLLASLKSGISHLYLHVCGIYSYNGSTKISLQLHLYHQNLKCSYRVYHQNLNI